MSNQEHHELYELLMTYLKAIQALTNAQKHIESLHSKYQTHQVLLWHTEPRQITCTVCSNVCNIHVQLCRLEFSTLAMNLYEEQMFRHLCRCHHQCNMTKPRKTDTFYRLINTG